MRNDRLPAIKIVLFRVSKLLTVFWRSPTGRDCNWRNTSSKNKNKQDAFGSVRDLIHFTLLGVGTSARSDADARRGCCGFSVF